ncbi:hypothetical protein ACWT_3218 [Actinoplanes sp. SE50]|uniref:hypothetical protein n=1 Tax=unclassified Actinoplanes TaxID=2626549 RepID=UPI00023EC961|nr:MULTISPECIES: hypothetical protein [unclassified Actinoplanes]AEV84241.1 hypothetical protein ACPL_3346 [Actinoplanes sp. SE50/110]ATO82633.1 hypothetical protein ACWT_3218 [Actinoplanes sp. SE50]SLM00040.1 hypothetical protein ACSP50_3272 [Actinoplanes sp. SE50/110]
MSCAHICPSVSATMLAWAATPRSPIPAGTSAGSNQRSRTAVSSPSDQPEWG